MIKINKNFDLKSTVFSGQCFRMSENNNIITLILDDRVIHIKENKLNYEIYSNEDKGLKEKINYYFDLNRDYEKINKKIITSDKEMKKIINVSKGYRILKQNKFEMFISYIISQNNNVKKISYSINKISEMFGKKVIYNNQEYYLFPTYNELKNVTYEDLKICKVGFRDKYIISALYEIKDNNKLLEDIENMNSSKAYEELLKIKGIGPKVASCILMFGYGRLDVYPIDTWTKKYLMNKYKINNTKNLQTELYKKYEEYVGLAVQYMFNYERNVKSQLDS